MQEVKVGDKCIVTKDKGLLVLASQTKGFKTQLLFDITYNFAKEGKRVVYNNVEQSVHALRTMLETKQVKEPKNVDITGAILIEDETYPTISQFLQIHAEADVIVLDSLLFYEGQEDIENVYATLKKYGEQNNILFVVGHQVSSAQSFDFDTIINHYQDEIDGVVINTEAVLVALQENGEAITIVVLDKEQEVAECVDIQVSEFIVPVA